MNRKTKGKFWEFSGKLAALLWLNALTLLCCLPVLTAGAAFSAMHRVLVQIYRDEESKLTKTFFAAFRDNWKQATGIFLIYLCYFCLLGAEYWAFRKLENPTLGYLQLLVPVLAFIGVLTLCWAFVLQSRYRLTVKDVFLYALTRCVAFPLRTLLMAATLVLPAVLTIYFPQMFILVPLLGFTGPGILRTCLYNKPLTVMEDADA